MKRITIICSLLILFSTNIYCGIFQDTLVDLRKTPLGYSGKNISVKITNSRDSKLHILYYDYKYNYPYVYYFKGLRPNLSIIDLRPTTTDFILDPKECHYANISFYFDVMDSVSFTGGYFRGVYIFKYKWEDDPLIYTDSLPILFSTVKKNSKLETISISSNVKEKCNSDSLKDIVLAYYIQNYSDSLFKVESIEFRNSENNVHNYYISDSYIPEDSILKTGGWSSSFTFSLNPNHIGKTTIFCDAVLKNTQSETKVKFQDSIVATTVAQEKLFFYDFDSDRSCRDSLAEVMDTVYFATTGSCGAENILINEINLHAEFNENQYDWLFDFDLPIALEELPINPQNNSYQTPLIRFLPKDLLGKEGLIEIKYTADGQDYVRYLYLTVTKIIPTTDVDDPISDSQTNSFPNPTSGVLNFKNPVEQIKIFDIYGKAILEHKDMADKIELNHLTNGFYIVTYIESNGVMKSERVMLAK